jgi:hypothetical protein
VYSPTINLCILHPKTVYSRFPEGIFYRQNCVFSNNQLVYSPPKTVYSQVPSEISYRKNFVFSDNQLVYSPPKNCVFSISFWDFLYEKLCILQQSTCVFSTRKLCILDFLKGFPIGKTVYSPTINLCILHTKSVYSRKNCVFSS